jgi:hypothetical protein
VQWPSISSSPDRAHVCRDAASSCCCSADWPLLLPRAISCLDSVLPGLKQQSVCMVLLMPLHHDQAGTAATSFRYAVSCEPVCMVACCFLIITQHGQQTRELQLTRKGGRAGRVEVLTEYLRALPRKTSCVIRCQYNSIVLRGHSASCKNAGPVQRTKTTKAGTNA